MRIIGGSLGGRRLAAPAGRRVRPTGDRMRESIFSVLGAWCREAVVLDLFAGSGALGFEALSRGASSATFVERDRRALITLRSNIESLGAGERCTVESAEALAWLERNGPGGEFDLTFADPPFESSLHGEVAGLWAEGAAAGSVLVLEHPASFKPQPGQCPEGGAAKIVKTAVFGESAYTIFQAPEGENGEEG